MFPLNSSKGGVAQLAFYRLAPCLTTLITEVYPGTRKMERKEKALKISCQNPVEHDTIIPENEAGAKSLFSPFR